DGDKKENIDAWNVLRTQHPSVGKVQFGDKKSAGLFYEPNGSLLPVV
ncbi:hypothetical protein JOD20_005234, partial [Herpetosiphon giganteus]|nr:hypothetical protein [Herpetosiphon giganteus]